MKKTPKNKKVIKDEIIEIDSGELSLILESLKEMSKKVEQERFYRTSHPRELYDIFLERYWRLISKLNVKLPKAVYFKMPKF